MSVAITHATLGIEVLIQGKVYSGIRRADHDKPYGLIYRAQAKSLDEN